MARLTPADVAAKFARNASASTQDWKKGIQGVTESPTKKAAANLGKAKANYIKAIDSGKMKRGLERVSLDDWKTKTVEIGESRFSQGVVAAQPKVEAFMSEFLPFLDTVKAKIDKMPNLSLEDNILKMVAQVRETAKFVRK